MVQDRAVKEDIMEKKRMPLMTGTEKRVLLGIVFGLALLFVIRKDVWLPLFFN